VLGKVRVGDLRRRLLTLVARDAALFMAESGVPDLPPVPDVLAELEDPATQEWIAKAIREARPSRTPDSDRMDRLATAALRYIEAFKRNPQKVLVEMLDIYKSAGEPISYSTARERVREARKLGLLVGGRRGRGGAMAGEKLAEWQREQAQRQGDE
jgi:hypothetical protein